MNHRRELLLKRIKILTWIFIIGLVISGVTAVPLLPEVNLLANHFAAGAKDSVVGEWLLRVRDALAQTQAQFPFLYYGTDWLAFGHVIIGLAFVGALRDPVHNRWLFDFGLMACALVIPVALVFGAVRGIPFWWRLIDCSFGVVGAIPLWLCRRWTLELERGLKDGD